MSYSKKTIQIEKEQEKHKEDLLKTEKEQIKIDEILQKKMENKLRFEKNIENEMSIFSQKSSENEKLKSQIDSLSLQVSDLEQAISIKSQVLEDLMGQDRRMKNSV